MMPDFNLLCHHHDLYKVRFSLVIRLYEKT